LVEPQNHSGGFRRFGLKTGGDGFHRFGLKTFGDGFRRFGLKTGTDGFHQFGLKTSGDGFLVWALKSSELRFVGCATKATEGGRRETCVETSGLLRVEASLARVSQSGLKTGGCATLGGARGTIAEVASEAS
jgi:hypothetical protein